jgi:hypothetical protein
MATRLNDHLKKVLKEQMLKPILYCPTHQCHCKFSTGDWCLVEYSPSDCQYVRTRKEEVVSFKRRER